MVFLARRRMSTLQYDSGPTSNDLLRRLVEKHTPATQKFQIIVQNADDVQNIENAPAIGIGTDYS